MRQLRLILASGSPRRKDLLEKAGFSFTVVPADVDETVPDGETPLAATVRLALEKAERVARTRPPEDLVLGADTSVVVGNRMIGKPADEAEAVSMLMDLSGRNHQVVTAWALLVGGAAACTSGFTVSTVRMGDISRAEARTYVAGGEPLDKAGSYAVQGEGRRFVAAVLGSLDNVIGLPVAQLSSVLAAAGIRADR